MNSLRLFPVISLLFLNLLFGTAMVYAQNTITIIENAAQSDFPNNITFLLEAESDAAPITQVKLLYGAARQETLTEVHVEITPGQRVQAQHKLDTQVTYLPPGTDLVYRWLIHDEDGTTLETSAQDLVYHDQRFTWQEQTARSVTVFWYQGGADFGDTLMQTAIRTIDRLQDEIGADVKDPIKIYIYASNRDMRPALQSNEVEWVGGQAWPDLGLIVGAIESGNTDEIQRLIPHELSHQVLHQAVDNPYGGLPVWFDEGLAVYNQEIADPGFTELLDAAASEGRLIPLEALSSGFPADPDQAALSYAQSHSIVDYIITTYGETALRELTVAFSQATPVEQALSETLGIGVDDLDAAWRETLPGARANVAPRAPTPAVAPANRFNNAPALNQPGGLPLQWESPGWASLTLAAFCCVGLVAVAGLTLLVALRLIGVDKRTS
ncbi:MAG: hypothetical protein MI924_08715 [Chloroflexales bacterium]|nr:hypothetical protein [Chloroflexales bacterium]